MLKYNDNNSNNRDFTRCETEYPWLVQMFRGQEVFSVGQHSFLSSADRDGIRQQYHTVSQLRRPHSEYAWGENLRYTAAANLTKTEAVVCA